MLTTAIDRKFKSQGYTKISESEYGVVYVKSERFGIAEIRIYHTSSDILIESVYTLGHTSIPKTIHYALTYKLLKLVDRKIRELKRKYQWGDEPSDDSGSRETDSNQSAD